MTPGLRKSPRTRPIGGDGMRSGGRTLSAAAGILAAMALAACGPVIPQRAAPSPRARIGSALHASVTPNGYSLTSLDFLTAQKGYVVGVRCAMGKDCSGGFGMTQDGGHSFTWTALGPGTPASVQFVDPSHGFVLSQSATGAARLLATSDGGRSWRTVGQEGQLRGAPQFVSPALGFAIVNGQGATAVMRPSSLVRTTNGGRSWQAVPTDGYYPVDVDFVDAQHGYLAAFRCGAKSCAAAILGTTDGGASWQVLQSVGSIQIGNIGTFALDFLTPSLGFVELPNLEGCTMGGCLSALEETRNGGKTFAQLQPAYQWGGGISSGWPGAPVFSSPELGWIGRTQGAGAGSVGFLVTQDGGRSFRQYGQSSYSVGPISPVWGEAYAIATPANDYGNGESALLRLTPQGTAVQVWPAPAPTRVLAAGNQGALFGLGLVTDPFALLQSHDGGSTWRKVGEVPGQTQMLLSFADPKKGWAVSSEFSPTGTQLYATADAGRSWRAVGPAPKDAPRYVHLFPGGTGIKVLYHVTGGEILRTQDGGKTWSQAGALPNRSVWTVAFATPQRGFAYAGHDGEATLLETQDGGRRWQVLLSVPHVPRTDFPGSAMAVDAQGLGIVQEYAGSAAYLVTRDGGRTWRTVNLPQIGEASAVAADGPRTLLILGPQGLYRSQDAGTHWSEVA